MWKRSLGVAGIAATIVAALIVVLCNRSPRNTSISARDQSHNIVVPGSGNNFTFNEGPTPNSPAATPRINDLRAKVAITGPPDLIRAMLDANAFDNTRVMLFKRTGLQPRVTLEDVCEFLSYDHPYWSIGPAVNGVPTAEASFRLERSTLCDNLMGHPVELLTDVNEVDLALSPLNDRNRPLFERLKREGATIEITVAINGLPTVNIFANPGRLDHMAIQPNSELSGGKPLYAFDRFGIKLDAANDFRDVSERYAQAAHLTP